MGAPPSHCWTRRLSAPDPSPRVHRNSTPPLLEILQLLPVAYRVGRYINAERYNQREPIFDLEGIDLHPPNPGPSAGVPCGGIGGGGIGRGFRGDFRRWSLFPGRYVHSVVHANQFSVRTRRRHTEDVAAAEEVNSPTSPTSPNSPTSSISSSSERAPLQSRPRARVLSVNDGSASGAMRNWEWSFPADNVTYHALYPRAWTVYEMPEDRLTLTCKQISPVIPHDYVNSSVPACVFEWTIDNHDSTEAEVSLMFTWDNNPALSAERRENERHETFTQTVQSKDDKLSQTRVHGVVMHTYYDSLKHAPLSEAQQSYCGQRTPDIVTHPMSMCIAAIAEDDVHVTACEAFRLSDGANAEAREVWQQFQQTGDIGNVQHTTPVAQSDPMAAAVCARVVVPANQSSKVAFVLSWDVSLACFGEGLHIPRFYTRWFGVGGRNAGAVASYAAHMYSSWDSDIAEWQESILADTELPDYYKSLLFNELYFITDGGTVWTDSTEGEVLPRGKGEERKDGGVEESHQFQQLVTVDADRQLMVIDANAASEFNHVAQNCEGDQSVIGQFLYLEGHEYLMYNTYDVHFYASFALLQLWPMLELSIQRDFARAVAVEDMDLRTMLGDGHVRPRKLAGSIAHDLGSPCEHPWKKPNIYNFQDVSQWKDLGPKFILQVYRDHMFVIKNTSKSSNPSKFLAALYDTCKRVMESCRRFDRDDDGMIENDGVPDQTYDIWSVTGVSAYCGGLWCAACSAMAAMAYCMDDAEAAALYDGLAAKARAVYDKQLWNGRYFNYDNNGGYSHDSIMADQLAGQWYCRVCDLPPVTEPAKAFSSYRTIFEHNVERFGDGRLLGAVNGMRPNGEVDSSALQAREVWTGTTYAVAAAMLLEAKALTTTDALPALADDDQLELVRMAFTTAQGIYEAGWKEFGYWFATPEGWERSGNYRSLGYMRPLAVWAIHFAWEKCYKSSSTANRGVVL